MAYTYQMWQVLNERRFNYRRIVYHGTSTYFLKSIMANGLSPEPTHKTWRADPDASATRPSRASLRGVYVTPKFHTASSSAGNTARKFGGEELYIVIEAQEKAGYWDEDRINTTVKSALERGMGIPGRYMFDLGHSYTVFQTWTRMKADATFRREVEDKFTEAFIEELSRHWMGGALHPEHEKFLRRMAPTLVHTELNRAVAYYVKEERERAGYYSPEFVQAALDQGMKLDGKTARDFMRGLKGDDAWEITKAKLYALAPTIPQAEKAHRRMLDRISKEMSRYETATAIAPHRRLQSVVGFRGRNRIIAMYVEPRDDEKWKKLYRVYGEGVPQFEADYKQAVSPNVEVESADWKEFLPERRRTPALVESAKGVADLVREDPNMVVLLLSYSPNSFQVVYWDIAAEDEAEMRGEVSIDRGGHGPCSDAFMVSGAEAGRGWGPLLYDVAMELATAAGGGLMSDRVTVSGDAARVWGYYDKRRRDVTKAQLDNQYGDLTPQDPSDDCDQGSAEDDADPWHLSALSRRFRRSQKDPRSTMRALAKAGRLYYNGPHIPSVVKRLAKHTDMQPSDFAGPLDPWEMAEAEDALRADLTERLHIRERVAALDEVAKGPRDLPSGIGIGVRAGNYISKVYYCDLETGEPSERPGLEGEITFHRVESIWPCEGAWEVKMSGATHGFGPLLYDAAVEVASILGGGLISDRRSVSNSARKVWKHYDTKRPDVEKHQLDNEYGTLTPARPEDDCDQALSRQKYGKRGWVKDPISRRYVIDPPYTLPMLARMDRLVIDGGDREDTIRGALTEAAKGPQALPPGVGVWVRAGNNIILTQYWDLEADSPAARPAGRITIARIDNPETPCDGAWEVDFSRSDHGFGPLLYDVAIELASIMGGGLISDRQDLSPAAYRVWKHYDTARPDVTKHQMDDEQGHLTPSNPNDDCDQWLAREKRGKRGWMKDPVSRRYRISPPYTLPMLARMGLLVLDGPAEDVVRRAVPAVMAVHKAHGGGLTEAAIQHASYGGKHQFIFRDGGKEVGEIAVVPVPGGFEVSNVMVWPAFQRRGWATKMYRHAARWAREQGGKLLVSDDRTPDALALHQDFAAKGYLHGREIVMERIELTPAHKKVIDAFLARRPAESAKLWTDGVALDLLWMGGGRFASWKGGRLHLEHAPTSPSEDTILRYLEKRHGKPAIMPALGLRFEHLHTDSYQGQHYMGLIARDHAGRVVGKVEYSYFDDGTARIDHIEVPEEHRRRGVATAMFQEIKRHHGLKSIPPSGLTDLGSKWREGSRLQERERDYRAEYARETRARKDDRCARNRARYKLIKKGKARVGDGKHVHHKDGNTRNNAAGNLANRAAFDHESDHKSGPPRKRRKRRLRK